MSIRTQGQRKKSRQSKGSLSTLVNLKAQIVKWAITQGTSKTLVVAGILAAVLGSLLYWQYIIPQATTNEELHKELARLRQQNAIARMIQETRPQFLDEFRRVVNNYMTARELLPRETEVSNVMAAIQEMARRNKVQVTVFDASKPGTRASSSPTAAAGAGNGPSNQPAPAAATAPSAAAGSNKKTPPAAATTAAAATTGTPAPIVLNERRIPAQVVGGHAAIASFIRDVAQYPRIIYVSDITINALNSQQESANLTLVTYDAPAAGLLPPLPAELQREFQEAVPLSTAANK